MIYDVVSGTLTPAYSVTAARAVAWGDSEIWFSPKLIYSPGGPHLFGYITGRNDRKSNVCHSGRNADDTNRRFMHGHVRLLLLSVNDYSAKPRNDHSLISRFPPQRSPTQ